MRKLLSGAAVALVCAVAASSASAALHTGSSTGPLVPSGTTITFSNAGSLTFTSAFFGSTTTCSGMRMSVSSTYYGATPVALDITQLSISGCPGWCGSLATVTESSFPWTAGSSLATTTSPNGSFTLKSPGQDIGWYMCGLHCNYGTGTSGMVATFTGGNPATLKFSSAAFGTSSCSDTATLTATLTSAGPNGNGLFTS